ncbi:MAG: large conductance mechanosensitive channel protein MscL [Ruminococcaceae bacterium]|nr:large conductance mechanosensitive channel protein MscL [Oscillospiraceae bacterium]
MKKLFKDFKDFINQGNVIDLAVGVIIGAAFKDVVTALVEKIITPVLNCIGSNADGKLSALRFEIIPGNEATTVEFGAFISSIISFILMAFIVFLIVKAFRKAATIGKKKKEEEEAETTKTCPFCKSEIDIEATRCPHCTSELPEEEAAEDADSDGE